MLLWEGREPGEAERNAADVGAGQRRVAGIRADWDAMRAQEARRLAECRRFYSWVHGMGVVLIYGGSGLVTVMLLVRLAIWLVRR